MIDSAECEQMISGIKVATLIKNSDNQNNLTNKLISFFGVEFKTHFIY